MDNMVSIYLYIDYRQYLSALYDDFKKNDSSFSFRSLARMAGSSSPNFFQQIRDRKLNISAHSLTMLAKALKLTSKEEEYLETIVAFDHAKTHDEKDKFFRRILQIRGQNNAVELQKEQYDFVSHWYIPVIRELLTCGNYNGDPQWVADRIVPQITLAQVKKGISLLQSLGLIIPEENGTKWRQTNRTISTPSEVLSVAAMNYHLDTIELGREALSRFNADQRDVRAITLGIPKSKISELKSRVESFWSDLLAFANESSEVEKVMQVNIQMFPMSKDCDSDEKNN
ncbi:MAG TPA: TIGR02147 family protein [Chitinispirillaceae bacterium]|nr:TIGR02147 family protein [Chitinispirillaceae bacterium]